MWGLGLTTLERAEWMEALRVASYSNAAAELYRWSSITSVVEAEFRAIAKAVSGVKSTYAADDLNIAAQILSGVASDLDAMRRSFAALAQDGDQP